MGTSTSYHKDLPMKMGYRPPGTSLLWKNGSKRQYSSKTKTSNVRDFLPVIGTVGRGMDGFRGPSGAHFVVYSLLVLGPKYQILPSKRFCAIVTPEKRDTWMRNG
jgi:hypothetical protein